MAFNTNIRGNLQNRAADFVREKLVQQGAEDINTDLVVQAFDQWKANHDFTRDLEADT